MVGFTFCFAIFMSKKYFQNFNHIVIFWAIVLIASLFRFYNLDWGDNFFFHPDEYHVASSVLKLSFPEKMHPHFFSYGTFGTYLIYFIKTIIPDFFGGRNGFSQSMLVGRFLSALFSVFTVVIAYGLGRRIMPKYKSLGLWIAFLTGMLPGLIQQAHYTTPESMLIFWLFLALYCWLSYMKINSLRWYWAGALCLGVAVGIKIAALSFLPLMAMAPIMSDWGKKKKKTIAHTILTWILKITAAFAFSALAFFIVYPYAVLDYPAFLSSMRYELGVGQGNPLVFYTRQFINTVPFWFQIKKIYLYALGPPILFTGFFGLVIMIKELFGKNKNKKILLFLILAFFFLYIPTSIVFAKWTRFSAPVFPFWAIFSGYFIVKPYLGFSKRDKAVWRGIVAIFALFSMVWAGMFFSIYLQPDVRITATRWINQYLLSGSHLVVESGNMLDLPLKGGKVTRASLDFYNMENDPAIQNQLIEELVQGDYFIIQSRRIFTNHMRLPEEYPFLTNFYRKLFSGQLGFSKIKEFKSYPGLQFLGINFSVADEQAEETWSVFDHPVIRVYQKTSDHSKASFERMLL
jgi:4-amino-4-deoxy-L-arabinose transferase-like glycosyltransferase